MPQRPRRKTQAELENYFLEHLGFNNETSYFKYDEGNEQGMSYNLGYNEM